MIAVESTLVDMLHEVGGPRLVRELAGVLAIEAEVLAEDEEFAARAAAVRSIALEMQDLAARLARAYKV